MNNGWPEYPYYYIKITPSSYNDLYHIALICEYESGMGTSEKVIKNILFVSPSNIGEFVRYLKEMANGKA